jgi:hypothetical protein
VRSFEGAQNGIFCCGGCLLANARQVQRTGAKAPGHDRYESGLRDRPERADTLCWQLHAGIVVDMAAFAMDGWAGDGTVRRGVVVAIQLKNIRRVLRVLDGCPEVQRMVPGASSTAGDRNCPGMGLEQRWIWWCNSCRPLAWVADQ